MLGRRLQSLRSSSFVYTRCKVSTEFISRRRSHSPLRTLILRESEMTLRSEEQLADGRSSFLCGFLVGRVVLRVLRSAPPIFGEIDGVNDSRTPRSYDSRTPLSLFLPLTLNESIADSVICLIFPSKIKISTATFY